MTTIQENITAIRRGLPEGVTLVCVSKYHPASMIEEAYAIGERDFGESRAQELVAKATTLPHDIRWHFIGHLQTNKVRQILPYVSLIQSVDSVRLLDTIEAEAARIDKVQDVLLEVHVAKEEAKSGFLPNELPTVEQIHAYSHIRVRGLMTMATNTDDEAEIRRCFRSLSSLLAADRFPYGEKEKWICSMGMSDDYPIAIEEGANMVRIGSSIFGERVY